MSDTGLGCPACDSRDHDVVDSRPCWHGIRRRRKCGNCEYRWTTHEKIAADTPEISRSRLEGTRARLAAILAEIDAVLAEGFGR